MRMRALIAAILGVSGTVALAQGMPPFQNEEVLVIVWSGADRCTVMDRKTNCSRVASMLTGRLQVGRNQTIVVASNSTDQDTMIRLAQVMSDLRAAGYSRVRQADPPR